MRKIPTPHFKEHYTKIDIPLVVISFFSVKTRMLKSLAKLSNIRFHEKLLPVNMKLLLTAKITPGLNTCTCHARAAQFSAC